MIIMYNDDRNGYIDYGDDNYSGGSSSSIIEVLVCLINVVRYSFLLYIELRF